MNKTLTASNAMLTANSTKGTVPSDKRMIIDNGAVSGNMLKPVGSVALAV